MLSLNAFLHSIEKEFLQPFVSEGFYHFVNVTYAVTLVQLYLARRSKQYNKTRTPTAYPIRVEF